MLPIRERERERERERDEVCVRFAHFGHDDMSKKVERKCLHGVRGGLGYVVTL